ncbi:ribosome biogenesis protein ytm1 [Coemansia sp. BCRC 34301]|nr:ribosome biogenesis protein ytm1 [Coemansia sp. BCRC 34301]
MDGYIQHLVGGNRDAHSDSDALLQSTLSLATVTELSQELGRRLDTSKAAIMRTLQENRDTYEHAISEADKAQSTIAELLRGVDDMQALLGDERSGIHARLVDATENEARLRSQMLENGAVLTCMRLLARLNADIHSMDACIRAGRLQQASEMILVLEKELSDAAATIGDTRIFGVLRNRMDLAKETVKQNVAAALHKLLVIRVDESLAQLCVCVDPLDKQRGVDSSTQSLFAALDILGVRDEIMVAYGAHFVKAFIRPVLATPGIVQDSSSAEESSQQFSIQRSSQANRVSGSADVCAIVLGAFTFASRALLQNTFARESTEQATRTATLWTRQCIFDVASMVLERCFLRCIPVTRRELEGFRGTADLLLEFESQLFELCSTTLSDRPIRTAVDGLDELFVQRRCEYAQSRVRDLVEDPNFAEFELEQHQAWSLDFVRDSAATTDCGVSPLLEKAVEQVAGTACATLVFPKCSISRSVHELVLEAYRLVNDAALSSSSPSHLSLLLSTARRALDMFCALYLTLHRAQLTRIPALAWQFFNDCLYASHHAGIIALLVPVLGDLKGSSAWLETANLFFGVGSAHAASVVSREAGELKALVADSSDAFYDAASEPAKAQLAKSRRQVHLLVAQLARAMQPPIVTPLIFYEALGRYIDAVYEATIKTIVGVRDIGVDDSQVLSDHCCSVGILGALFQLDSCVLESYRNFLAATSGCAYGVNAEADELVCSDDAEGSAASARLAKEYCKLASKLVQLADILLISRADILARRRAGLLAQFTIEELVALICALFSDTKERAHDIATLKSLD